MKFKNTKYRFWLMIIGEAILFPFLYLRNYLFNRGILRKRARASRPQRQRVDSNTIDVSIHEWGGYGIVREKAVSVIPRFECGLKYQIERFSSYSGKYKINLMLTMSEPQKFKQLDYLESKGVTPVAVDNKGMDFSGYSHYCKQLKSNENRFVILTNSSVNSLQTDFLDGYIDYMQQNPDVGMMGVSYSAKVYQSLLRNNFTPHLQSFFLLTTNSVLSEIIEYNNSFPGQGVSHKLLLIRKGEVGISQIALKLGYSLAVVLDSGEVCKFNDTTISNDWVGFRGDMRLTVENPNAINCIREHVVLPGQ